MIIENYKDKHVGERCYVLANGPSLNEVDFDKLDGPTIGTNRIYLKHQPDYYVCVNPLVLEQFADEISKLTCPKFINGTTLDTSSHEVRFGTDITKPIWEGHTVTFVALQLAYYMGFAEVIVLGLDHHYDTPEGVGPNEEVVTDGYDTNHFDPNYFGKGAKWHTPDLKMSEQAYALARDAFKQDGRWIINASHSTKCRVFPLQPLNHVLHPDPPLVSAIVSAYKSKEFFGKCIEDLTEQSIWEGGKLEIVVVCQENSFEHNAAVAFRDKFEVPNLVIETTKDIPTVYKAWNLGIRRASGRFLTNANTDDRHFRFAYEIMAATLGSLTHVDLVYHDSYVGWVPNQTFEEWANEHNGKEIVAGREVDEPGVFIWPEYSRGLLADGCYMGPHPMWRANLHQFHGYFMDGWKSAGDYEFWLRIGRKDNMFHIPVVMGLYHGRVDGVELGDPEASMEESSRALMLHQNMAAHIKIVGEDHVRIEIGDQYTYVERSDFLDLADKIRTG